MSAPSSIDGDAEALLEVLQKHVAQIMEHASSVQIICTLHDPAGGSTASVKAGAGDMYARIGAVGEWLSDQTSPEEA